MKKTLVSTQTANHLWVAITISICSKPLIWTQPGQPLWDYHLAHIV